MSIEIDSKDLRISEFSVKGHTGWYGVEILHVPTGIHVIESSSYDPSINRHAAMNKLAQALENLKKEKSRDTEEIVHYQTKAEIWQYLLDGGAVRRKGSISIAKLKDGTTPYHFDNPKDWEPYEEPKPWYENIPEKGILCWVSQREETDKLASDTINMFSKTGGFNFRGKYGAYRYATPVTLEEIKDLIYKPE